MSHKAAKIGVTTLVLATVFGILMYTTLSESMQYYKYVDEVTESPDAWMGKKLHVHGYVVPGSIGRTTQGERMVCTPDRRGRARWRWMYPSTWIG